MKKINVSQQKFIQKAKSRWFYVLVGVFFMVCCAVILYPYIYCLLGSIRTPNFTFSISSFLPFPAAWDQIHFGNYADAFEMLNYDGKNVIDMFLNSLWYSLGMTFVGLLYATVSAYVCAKYHFFGRRLIYTFAIIMMIVPIIGATASNIRYTAFLGGYDNPLYVLINAQTINGSFIIIYSCFKSLSWSYAESSFIDGAGHFKTFFRIMLPQVVSPLSALALTNFIAAWSDAETSLLYFPHYPTLATGIYYAAENYIRSVRFPIFLASLILVMLPSVILFSIFQKKMMDIQMGGALKG